MKYLSYFLLFLYHVLRAPFIAFCNNLQQSPSGYVSLLLFPNLHFTVSVNIVSLFLPTAIHHQSSIMPKDADAMKEWREKIKKKALEGELVWTRMGNGPRKGTDEHKLWLSVLACPRHGQQPKIKGFFQS